MRHRGDKQMARVPSGWCRQGLHKNKKRDTLTADGHCIEQSRCSLEKNVQHVDHWSKGACTHERLYLCPRLHRCLCLRLPLCAPPPAHEVNLGARAPALTCLRV